jgi:hypothetical protein
VVRAAPFEPARNRCEVRRYRHAERQPIYRAARMPRLGHREPPLGWRSSDARAQPPYRVGACPSAKCFSPEPSLSRVLFRRCRRWWSFLWAARYRTARATNSGSDRRGPRRRGRPSRTHSRSRTGLAPGGVCRAPLVTEGAVRSYRAVSPLPVANPPRAGGPAWGPWAAPAVCFLLHCPSSHPDWPLASTLPCGARTFLDGSKSPPRPPVQLEREAQPLYQLPPRADRDLSSRSGSRRSGHGCLPTGRAAGPARLSRLERGRSRLCPSSDQPSR